MVTVLIGKKLTIILQVDDNHVIRYIPPEDFAKTTGMIFQNLFGVVLVFHFVGKVNKGFFGHIMLKIFRVYPKKPQG